MSHSALYEGTVRHRRFAPVGHEFRQRLFLAYLDLDELSHVFSGSRLAAVDKRALLWFRRADYLDGATGPLDDALRDLVTNRTGRQPRGPIRMLTHLRSFGHVFNPITIYYCFDEHGTKVDTLVLEVTNTPWGERNVYVIDVDGDPRKEHSFEKEMHVSPFMPMDIVYRITATTPADRVWVRMVLVPKDRPAEPLFDADLALRRVSLSRQSLRRTLIRHPMMTLCITAGIHYQALRLWAKRVPFATHPPIIPAEELTRRNGLAAVSGTDRNNRQGAA